MIYTTRYTSIGQSNFSLLISFQNRKNAQEKLLILKDFFLKDLILKDVWAFFETRLVTYCVIQKLGLICASKTV